MGSPTRALAPALLLPALVLAALVGGCQSLEGARLYRSGTLALERGEYELAARELESAAQRVPHASEIQNHLGLSYAGLGRDREALAAFQRAVDLDCDNAAARRNLFALEEGSLEGERRGR